MKLFFKNLNLSWKKSIKIGASLIGVGIVAASVGGFISANEKKVSQGTNANQVNMKNSGFGTITNVNSITKDDVQALMQRPLITAKYKSVLITDFDNLISFNKIKDDLKKTRSFKNSDINISVTKTNGKVWVKHDATKLKYAYITVTFTNSSGSKSLDSYIYFAK